VEILKSAAAAFRTRGYHATSVDDIAQTLRMTKGSL
jgi:AcrR family transcriptional regulator